MEKRKYIVITFILLFLVVLVLSIQAALNFSDESLKQQSLETLSQSQGQDNHLAVGENMLTQKYNHIINANNEVESIVHNHDVTVMNFFASWCGPCDREMPELKTFHNKSDDNVAVIGINIDDTEANRDEFLSKHKVDFPIYEFSDETNALDEYSVKVMPTTFFVNRKGEVIRAYIGEVSYDLVQNYVNYVKEES